MPLKTDYVSKQETARMEARAGCCMEPRVATQLILEKLVGASAAHSSPRLSAKQLQPPSLLTNKDYYT
ncbi:hypothetical protein LEMLEM_LOCUS1210, partial [Lemmus lemmus]